MIFTQYGATVRIVGKAPLVEGNPPDMPGLVKIEYDDGQTAWRSPYELRADGGYEEIRAAVQNVPEEEYSK